MMNARTLVLWLFRLNGAVMIGNGLWMLGSALHWFLTVPAGLADTGPPNAHFIRDVGLCYLIFGAALLWASRDFAAQRALFLCAGAFMAGHALGHVGEMLLGALPHSHWLIDLPLVLLPGAFFALFMMPAPWHWLNKRAEVLP